jgi:ubiquinone/menaquinone biosynthesis C-methylase UbiE
MMSKAAYDAIAKWYDAVVRSGGLIHDVVLPSVYALIGDPQGQTICDLACGQGIVSRDLARQGAQMIGVDLSGKLLELARHYQNDEMQHIAYIQADAQALAFGNEIFDGVVCNMALMDIPDLRTVLLNVARILKQRGWFVFSITHPCLEIIRAQTRWIRDETGEQAVNSYFVEGLWRSDNVDGIRGKVGAYHRTLTTYINAVWDAGLVVEHLVEPQAVDEMAVRYPAYRDNPTTLVARCRKR